MTILMTSTAASFGGGGAFAADKPIWFDIPAEPLTSAISEYSRQAHISIGTSSTELSSLKSRAIRGYMSPDEALKRLLADTGITYRFVGSDAAVIAPAPKTVATTPPSVQEPVTPLPIRPYIADVVVTATKLAYRAQNVPASVSVVEGSSIEDLGIARVGELTSQVPGLMTTNQGPGRNKLFIRGLSDGSFSGQTQSTVGVYLDVAPMTFNDPYPDIKLVDIDRVEVLQGPQGTLYGAGAVSGVFRVIPNYPDLENISGNAIVSNSYTEDGKFNHAGEGVLNVPIVQDRLGIRFAGSAERDSGYIDDIRLGLKDVNKASINAIRGILRWRPLDNWTLDLTGSVQKTELDDTQYFVESLGRYNRDNYLAEPYSDLFKLGNAKVTGEMGWATFLSSTTVVRRDNRARNDATLAVSQFINIPVSPSPFDTRRDIDTISEEMRLSSQGSRVDWMVGGFYLRRNEAGTYNLTAPGAGDVLGSAAPSDVIFSEQRFDHVRELAFFGNASVELGWHIRLGLGARFFRSKYFTSATLDSVINPGVVQVSGTNPHNGITPQAVLSYQPTDDFLLYVSASEGYRNGGININTPLDAIIGFEPDESGQKVKAFNPDHLWNFELGTKKEWFDNRLRLNGSIFYVFWTGIQTDQYLTNGLPYVLNAGNATNYGFELELNALVTDSLQVSANVFWNSPQLSEANSFLGAKKGDRLPGISDFAVGASATYRFELGYGLHGTLSARYNYTGQSYLMFGDNSPSMGNYHVTDLRLEITKNAWSVGTFLQNSWSETGNSFSFGNPFSLPFEKQVTPLRPLTAGLSFRFDY